MVTVTVRVIKGNKMITIREIRLETIEEALSFWNQFQSVDVAQKPTVPVPPKKSVDGAGETRKMRMEEVFKEMHRISNEGGDPTSVLESIGYGSIENIPNSEISSTLEILGTY